MEENKRQLDKYMRDLLHLSCVGYLPVETPKGRRVREEWREKFSIICKDVEKLHDNGGFNDEMYNIFMTTWNEWKCVLTDEYWAFREKYCGYGKKTDDLPFNP